MGLHETPMKVGEMLCLAEGLLTGHPYEPGLSDLRIKLESLKTDLEQYMAQHQLEDEFRKIHDLPPTVRVKIPKGWTPEKGKVLTGKERESLLPGAKGKSRKKS